MRFLRNTWYVAAWGEDLRPGELVYRRFLGEPVVLFRKDDGTAVAMENVCPHRYAPLHLGKLLPGDRLRCGYHGLEFDTTGQCVRNPHGEGKIVASLRVKTYPLVEKHTLLWIWMGDEPADPAMIPDFAMMNEGDGRSRGRDYITINANYLLVVENLFDLSHANYLHEGILGFPEHESARVGMEQQGNTVYCRRSIANARVAQLHDLLFKRDGRPVDMWTDIRWDPPACLLLTHGFTRPGASREEGLTFDAIHMLTPETDRTTHYHFGIVRKPTRDEPEVQKVVAELRRHAFEDQDKLMLEGQQEMIGERDILEMRPVLLSVDAASMRMRRVLKQLIESESARASV